MTSCYLAESNNRGVLINLWLITNVTMSEQYVYLVCISNKEKYSESNVYEFRESADAHSLNVPFQGCLVWDVTATRYLHNLADIQVP